MPKHKITLYTRTGSPASPSEVVANEWNATPRNLIGAARALDLKRGWLANANRPASDTWLTVHGIEVDDRELHRATEYHPRMRMDRGLGTDENRMEACERLIWRAQTKALSLEPAP